MFLGPWQEASTMRTLLAAVVYAAAGLGLAGCDARGPTLPAESPPTGPGEARLASSSLSVSQLSLSLDGNNVAAGGTVVIQQFALQGGQLTASGTLDLSVTLNGTTIPVHESF